MSIDAAHARRLLRQGDLVTLFADELGWERHHATRSIAVEGHSFTLQAVAQKRGMVAYLCVAPDGQIPDPRRRRAIEQQVARVAHEHLLIFADAAYTETIWLWVRRAAGQPTAYREYAHRRDQTGDTLLQRLRAIAFSLDEEADLTLTDVVRRTRAAFDVDRVTKRFYEGYKAEHTAFTATIAGITDEGLQRWYGSVMLNRLMFAYFIQQKLFLDDNPNYLRHKLQQSGQRGDNRFYRDFLRPLFFDGLAKPATTRPAHVQGLLGNVPYLNGGLFLPHRIEAQYGDEISIPDAAFVSPLDFFDQYHWHLDDRPGHDDNEINPEVLGYIFEKYINQKQMGAYYTKEDITAYIARSSIIPRLFDAVAEEQPCALLSDHTLWDGLARDPDRAIGPDVQHGTALPLPSEIQAGLRGVAQRGLWNSTAAPEYALPSESWRDVVTRRDRYATIRDQLVSGKLRSINALLTANLDLTIFAQDVIANITDAPLLLAFWHGVAQMTVLDSTCGSGAFLFAALHVLQPLYDACLDRMAVLVSDGERSGDDAASSLTTLRAVLSQVAAHPWNARTSGTLHRLSAMAQPLGGATRQAICRRRHEPDDHAAPKDARHALSLHNRIPPLVERHAE